MDDEALRSRVALEGKIDVSNPAMVAEGRVEACTKGVDRHSGAAVDTRRSQPGSGAARESSRGAWVRASNTSLAIRNLE